MPTLGTSAQSPGCEDCTDYSQATMEQVLMEEFMSEGVISYMGFDEKVGCRNRELEASNWSATELGFGLGFVGGSLLVVFFV